MSSHQLSETQIRILETTRRLIEKRQGSAVRVEDIAQAAGVSRQAVYLNFGSRSGLLIATVRYIDHVLGLEERTRPIYEAKTALEMLDAKIVFWANYMPDIYGVAKALIAARETDKAAAAAWQDRMDELYEGLRAVVARLESEGILSDDWSVDEAAEFFRATVSIASWEYLTIERGWSNDQFIRRVQMAVKSTLLKPEALRAATNS
jgi:AcrR family transcriptional regulator